ncbi:MAG TPA: metal-dependent hydrolase [Saprospiraceae bacterium]|nr:metal-dependent hydrolase [Saprospiraceae bacterium]
MALIIQFLGHSGFRVQCGSTSMIVDPFFPESSSQVFNEIKDLHCDLLLLTHGHQDHIKDADHFLAKQGCQLIANFEIVNWFEKKFPRASFHPMNIGGKFQFQGVSIKMVAAMHSSTMPDGSAGGLACGFIIEDHKSALYIAGDTGLTADMQLIQGFIRSELTAIMPIGGCFTMDVEDALKAASMTGAKRVIGCHYNTFPPIRIDINQSKTQFEQAGIPLVLLDVGEQIEI